MQNLLLPPYSTQPMFTYLCIYSTDRKDPGDIASVRSEGVEFGERNGAGEDKMRC